MTPSRRQDPHIARVVLFPVQSVEIRTVSEGRVEGSVAAARRQTRRRHIQTQTVQPASIECQHRRCNWGLELGIPGCGRERGKDNPHALWLITIPPFALVLASGWNTSIGKGKVVAVAWHSDTHYIPYHTPHSHVWMKVWGIQAKRERGGGGLVLSNWEACPSFSGFCSCK